MTIPWCSSWCRIPSILLLRRLVQCWDYLEATWVFGIAWVSKNIDRFNTRNQTARIHQLVFVLLLTSCAANFFGWKPRRPKLRTDYYHVGLLAAISDNHQDHAEDESDAPQLDWWVALILRPMTLQHFLDHFKDFREKQEHKKRNINYAQYATAIGVISTTLPGSGQCIPPFILLLTRAW